jgi:CubicO group peptidase (beta-lactamase class C family)
MHRHLGFLFAVLVPFAPSPASAQYIIGVRDSQAIRVDSVFRPFDRTDSPGCALGVYQNGALQYGRGYGMASLEHGVALSPRSVLDVGSISKQFTAMAMLILQKEGKLSLDDPIRKYFPEMPAYADRVTWRRALSQTSGLRDLWTLWGQTGRTFAGDTVDALQVITHSAEPNYEPGERYLYTNSGWILAAQVVYRLTGKTLAQFAEERIFAPLGMRDTRYLADRAAVIPNLAESYSPRERGFRIQRSNYDGAIQGPGGVHTTVEDFGRWLNNYDAATVGGGDLIATMTTATKLNNGSPAWTGPPGAQAYAIGLSVGTVRGLRTISHGGSWAGFRGHFLRFPDQRFAVATFCNLSTAGPDSLAQKVAAIYLGDRMQPDSAAAWTAALVQAPKAEVSVATLRGLAGVWRNDERGEVRRTRLKGDTLVSDGDTPTPYVPLGEGRFRNGRVTEIRFQMDSTPARMLVRTTTGSVTYTRAEAATLDSAKLAEYVGDYRNDEVEVTHTWKLEKGQLVVYAGYRRLGVLEPSYQDGFTRGGSVIDVTRDKRGRITGFTLESGRVRHLRFTRLR